MTRTAHILALALLTALILAGCPKRVVVIDGKEVPVEEAAARKVAVAQRLQADGKAEEALGVYQGVVRDFPDTVAGGEARIGMAAVLVDAGKYKEAAAGLRKFLFDYPEGALKGLHENTAEQIYHPDGSAVMAGFYYS